MFKWLKSLFGVEEASLEPTLQADKDVAEKTVTKKTVTKKPATKKTTTKKAAAITTAPKKRGRPKKALSE